MSVVFEDKNRLVMPRCLEYLTACSLGLLRTIRKKREVPIADMNDSNAKTEWLEKPTIPSAVDLVAEALIVKDFESREAAEAAKYIIEKTRVSSVLIRQLANHFLETPRVDWVEPSDIEPADTSRGYVSQLKKSVRMHPRNPIAWSDLSLYHATLGQIDKAHKAMTVALGLSNNNRFILRGASRCFMHMDEPDRAVAVLRRSGLCEFDPWIASAEITISEGFGLKSKYIGKSKYMIDDDNLTHFARSELTSGMATIELKNGSLKRAKKLMRQALRDPTENALAQVEWLSNLIKEDIPEIDKLGNVPASYEAKTLHLFYNKRFKESLEASKMWSRYQFLSSRPVLHSSHIAACPMNDDTEAIRILRSCTPAQENDPMVMNNYAFSLARSGEVDCAVGVLKRVNFDSLSQQQKFVIAATEGLIAFRSGNIEKGRSLYSIAVRGFERIDNLYAATMATYFQAVEEKRINAQTAKSIVEEAKNKIGRFNVFELEDLAKKL